MTSGGGTIEISPRCSRLPAAAEPIASQQGDPVLIARAISLSRLLFLALDGLERIFRHCLVEWASSTSSSRLCHFVAERKVASARWRKQGRPATAAADTAPVLYSFIATKGKVKLCISNALLSLPRKWCRIPNFCMFRRFFFLGRCPLVTAAIHSR